MSSVLAVIDMQRVFEDPDSPWAVPRFAEAVAGISRLLPAFDDVVFTRFVAPEKPEGAWIPYYEQWPFALQPPESDLWQLSAPFAARAVDTLDAPTFGKWTPDLAERVGPGGHLVLAGVSTDCCVLSTAIPAADAGIHVTVVSDACAGVDDAAHTRALDAMSLYAPLIEIRPAEDLLH